MNFRTGDILVWRSTNFYDALSDSIFMVGGFHAGMVFVGKSFAALSVCGESPSNTYCTFLVDQIFPIEEVIGHVWHRPNGSALFYIRRTEGPDIPEELAFRVLNDFLALEKLPFIYSAYIVSVGYLRIGGVAPSSGYDNKRWHVCSLLIGYCLEHFDLLTPDCISNNLLPLDFYELKFYQRYSYEKIEFFDKQTHTYSFMFSAFFINMGLVQPEPLTCPIVDILLENYDYPRSVQSSVKQKADLYLQK